MRTKWSSILKGLLLCALPTGLVLASWLAPDGAYADGGAKYIGVAKCADCHNDEATGDHFKKWQAAKHANAWKVLASPEALAAGKERGIANPQQSDACLKCHVTAFGVDASLIADGFDKTQGVQCESCHGPGENHRKARLAAAMEGEDDGGFGGFGDDDFGDDEYEYEPLPEGELWTPVATAKCLECHNEESPTFQGFCFKERFLGMAHLDPRRDRTERLLEALQGPCDCGASPCDCGGSSCTTLEEILEGLGD